MNIVIFAFCLHSKYIHLLCKQEVGYKLCFLHNEKTKITPLSKYSITKSCKISNTAFLFYQIYGRIECEKYFNVKD